MRRTQFRGIRQRIAAGFTIVELVVSISVIALLAALLIPAVQRTRETSRRLKCQNNLKQIGIALEMSVELNGAYPSEHYLLWESLPGLGQQPLYDSLQSIFKSPTLEDLKKYKTLTFAVPEFVCPDETANMDGGNSNYYGNEGTQLQDNQPTNGPFRKPLLTRSADVTDGLSNTAAVSERLVGTYESRVKPEKGRTFWFTGTRYARPGDELRAVQECRENRTAFDPQFYSTRASSYRSIGTGYNHLLLPNEWACYNGPEDFQSTTIYYLIPPSSYHDQGVNVLLMDGSVRFIHDGIDEAIWRAIGTIAGAETVSILF